MMTRSYTACGDVIGERTVAPHRETIWLFSRLLGHEPQAPTDDGKNPAAVPVGRLGRKRDGVARAKERAVEQPLDEAELRSSRRLMLLAARDLIGRLSEWC